MRQAKEEAVKEEGMRGLVERGGERERRGRGRRGAQHSPLTREAWWQGFIEGGGGQGDRTAAAIGSSSWDRVSGGDPRCTAAAVTPGIHSAGGSDPQQSHGQASGSLLWRLPGWLIEEVFSLWVQKQSDKMELPLKTQALQEDWPHAVWYRVGYASASTTSH